jgi:SAM-dependent methyltransferase
MRRAQNHVHTHLFRRTDVLRTAQAQLGTPPDGKLPDRPLKILSFGCSTGEEIVTIRSIFPDADLYGCEIEPVALHEAMATTGHLATIFKSDRAAIRDHGPFDLINCASVLCLDPPTDMQKLFPPEDFDELLSVLDSALRPGGIIALTNASYRFYDSALAPHYDPVRSDIVFTSGFVNVYAHDRRPFLERIRRPSYVAFRRGIAFEIREEEELADSLFRKRLPGEAPQKRFLTLAPVPAGFEQLFAFDRSNLLALPAAQRVNAIEIVRHYRFGIDRATGTRGYALQIGWSTLAGGEHLRPPLWDRLNDFVLDR